MGLEEIRKKIEKGWRLTSDDGQQLASLMASGKGAALFALAREIQGQFHGPVIELCAIVNAKSGGCRHDCSFCAQSGHNKSPVRSYPLRPAKDILDAARGAERAGAHRFSIVTSGVSLSEKEIRVICEAIHLIRQETDLLPCASLGQLAPEIAVLLKEAGLVRYHHNLEASRNFYPRICTTQSYEERLSTIRVAKEAGLEICVGGILGLGESVQDRVDLALEIKNLQSDSVPLNFLDPRPGTPLETRPLLTAVEAAQAIAIFRILMPEATLRLAGGRVRVLGDEQAAAIKLGVNGLMIGDYLTTRGAETGADRGLIASLNLRPSIIDKGKRVYQKSQIGT